MKWQSKNGKELEVRAVVKFSTGKHYCYPWAEGYIDGIRSPGALVDRDENLSDGTHCVASIGHIALDADQKAKFGEEMAAVMAQPGLPPVKAGLEQYSDEIGLATQAYSAAVRSNCAVNDLSATHASQELFEMASEHLTKLSSKLEEALRNVPCIGYVKKSTYNYGSLPVSAETPYSYLHAIIQRLARGRFKRPDPIAENHPVEGYAFFADVEEQKKQAALEEEFADLLEKWIADSY